MSISAAVDGLGVCLDSILLAQQELRTGKLIIPFPTEGIKAQGHAMITLKSMVDVPKIRLFREWLFSELRKERKWEERLLSEAGIDLLPDIAAR